MKKKKNKKYNKQYITNEDKMLEVIDFLDKLSVNYIRISKNEIDVFVGGTKIKYFSRVQWYSTKGYPDGRGKENFFALVKKLQALDCKQFKLNNEKTN